MNNFDEVFDFVVVGNGGGSMCAALYLKSKGKDTVILEKTAFAGGTSARSGGVMWIPNNPIMKQAGIEDSYEQAALYLDTLMSKYDEAPGATPDRRRRYLMEGPEMVAFLQAQGIKLSRVGYYPDYYNNLPGGCTPGRTVIAELFNIKELGDWEHKLQPGFMNLPLLIEEARFVPSFRRSWKGKKMLLTMIGRIIVQKLTGKRLVTAGAALQGRMLQATLKAEIDLRLESPVQELIEENGVIIGVLTVKNGKPWRIGARTGVLVNAGGFAHNQQMRDQYQPGTSSDWSFAAPGDTGEMIQEMMRHGAAIAQMEEMVGHQISPPLAGSNDINSRSIQGLAAGPHAIMVDSSGVRYQNECGSYMDFCKGMLDRNKVVPAVPSWVVFDSQCVKKYMISGTMPGSKKPDSWYDSGLFVKADTLAALAQKLGIDSNILRSTVDRFNTFVANNCDEDFRRGDSAYDRWLGDPFHQPNETLGTIEQGPFYAMRAVPGDVGTYGGVLTDEYARVVREDGSVIPGLFATGVSTASVMGRVYPGAGSSVGPSFVWGYVAAKYSVGRYAEESANNYAKTAGESSADPVVGS